MNLIRESKSVHSSPAFMVIKQSDIKRGKGRMVINYNEVNKNIKFDGYYFPNKEILINLGRGNTITINLIANRDSGRLKWIITVYILKLLVHLEAIMNR